MRVSLESLMIAVAATFLSTVMPNAAMAQPAPVPHRGSVVQLGEGAIASLPHRPASERSLPRLIVLLHGAGQVPEQMIARFEDDPDCVDAVLLAPKSAKATWDVIAMAERRAAEGTSLANDVLAYSNSADGDRVTSAIKALQSTMETDPGSTLLLGFSDGATFALALGTGRDRPFTAVVAVAPGLVVVPARAAARRPVLIMHGRSDRSLPFDFTRGTIVPALRSNGVTVRFVPFDGGHQIPEGVLATLRREFAATGNSARR